MKLTVWKPRDFNKRFIWSDRKNPNSSVSFFWLVCCNPGYRRPWRDWSPLLIQLTQLQATGGTSLQPQLVFSIFSRRASEL